MNRWTGADPAGLIDGTNCFVYVKNMPIFSYDLFGLFCIPMPAPFWTLVDKQATKNTEIRVVFFTSDAWGPYSIAHWTLWRLWIFSYVRHRYYLCCEKDNCGDRHCRFKDKLETKTKEVYRNEDSIWTNAITNGYGTTCATNPCTGRQVCD